MQHEIFVELLAASLTPDQRALAPGEAIGDLASELWTDRITRMWVGPAQM